MGEEAKRDVAADRATLARLKADLSPMASMAETIFAASVLPHYLTRTEAAESRVAELEGAVERLIDLLIAGDVCPPGKAAHCLVTPADICENCLREWAEKGEEKRG